MSSNNAFKTKRTTVIKSVPSLTEANFPGLSVSVCNVIKPSLTQWASIAATRIKTTTVAAVVEEFSQQPSYAKMISNPPFDYAEWYNGMHREIGYDDYFSEAYLSEAYLESVEEEDFDY